MTGTKIASLYPPDCLLLFYSPLFTFCHLLLRCGSTSRKLEINQPEREYCRRLMRRMDFFFWMRRSSLLDTNQRLRRTVLKIPLLATFLRKRLSNWSCDSFGRKFTEVNLFISFHIKLPGSHSRPFLSISLRISRAFKE